MTEGLKQYFKVGEIVIIQSDYRTARHLWGKEAIITEVFAPGEEDNVIEGSIPQWNYKADTPSPPPSKNMPEEPKINWLWGSDELKKKYESGAEAESLMYALMDSPEKILTYSE